MEEPDRFLTAIYDREAAGLAGMRLPAAERWRREAELAAKRQRVSRYRGKIGDWLMRFGDDGEAMRHAAFGALQAAMIDLRADAFIYASEPGYRQQWRLDRYAVIRFAPGYPPEHIPRDRDGWWFDRWAEPQAVVSPCAQRGHEHAYPTGRYELRDHDLVAAEVYEVPLPGTRPCPEPEPVKARGA